MSANDRTDGADDGVRNERREESLDDSIQQRFRCWKRIGMHNREPVGHLAVLFCFPQFQANGLVLL